MGDVADLLMPKLGLTMTEGTVVRWLAAPGQRFAAGDVIVIIETDKIANEIEAPAAGELVALLSTEGEVASVGTPIAQWRLDEASPRPAKPPAEVEGPAPQNTSAAESVAVRATGANRIIATPYARRLAREASLDLAVIAGSGPRGRIKAADVLHAKAAQTSDQMIGPAAIAMQRTAPTAAHPATLSLMTVDVDVSALRALDARLAGSRDLPFERRAYLALACLKVLGTDDETPVRLGFRSNGDLATLEGTARDTLSTIAARLANIQPGGPSGDVAIFVVEGRARLLVPAVPHGWRMAFGVGGVRSGRGGEATLEMTLALVHDPANVDHECAAQLLDRIAALLEEPLHLLAV
jgi:pyruvate dehydrogenase E2 component (dihydrolipoamide acetyltransferase)